MNYKYTRLDIFKNSHSMVSASNLFQGTKYMHQFPGQANFASKAILADIS